MAEEIDFENRHIWHLTPSALCPMSCDCHLLRDILDLRYESESLLVAFFYDTTIACLTLKASQLKTRFSYSL